MTNPARDLADRLTAWQVPSNSSPSTVRTRVAEESDETLLESQVDAIDWLLKCREWLKVLERRGRNVGAYHRAFQHWHDAVVWRRGDFNAGNSAPRRIGEAHLDLLYSLAELIDTYQEFEQLPPEAMTPIEAAVNEAERLVSEEGSLNSHAKSRLLDVLGSIRRAAQAGDRAEVAQGAVQFVGMIEIISVGQDPEAKGRLANIRDKFLAAFMSGAGRSLSFSVR